uniref:Uncharacterized protein n=1 Tax=Acrobeloides nanus TaxID=290746 RepID=A0A914CQP1_9BILA
MKVKLKDMNAKNALLILMKEVDGEIEVDGVEIEVDGVEIEVDGVEIE